MTAPETHVVETCLFCNLKIRLLQEKAASARCPKCKGPLGDPKIEHACGCGAVNRVLRSRLAAARCGRCKLPLFQEGAVPRALVVAEAQELVGQILGDPLLAPRGGRPANLVEAVDLLKVMPQRIAELAASGRPNLDRERLSHLSGRCRTLVGRLRPHCFEASGLLHSDAFVQHFMLEDAFQAMRAHPLGWESLKAIAKQDKGLPAARVELAPAGTVFEQILNRLHKTDWDDMDGDRLRRRELADRLYADLSKVVESWLLRPYKLEAMVKAAMTRLAELPGAAAAFAAHEAALKEDVTVFLSIATTMVARGVVHHALGSNPKEVWFGLSRTLRGTALASA